MTISPNGVLYVGTMDQGLVYSITKGKVVTLFSELNMPQGVLWNANELYIAEIQRISKVVNLNTKPTLEPIKVFPDKKWHGWKTITKGPDGKLYVRIGAHCRMDFDGKNFETIVTGIRNTVGYTWNPATKELYFTEMGRDQMGENIPPDEINVIA